MENEKETKLTNGDKVGAAAFLIAMVLALGMIVYMVLYTNRYSLGLKKPSFQPGECISREYSNEFERSTSEYVILIVGEKEYLTYAYGENGLVWKRGFKTVKNIEITDLHAKKVSCPPFEQLEAQK